MSLIATGWRSLRTQVLEHRAQLSLSVRVTAAAVSSLILSHLLHLPVPLWAVLTAVILTQASFGRSLKATIDYLIGTVGGAIYTGALAALLPHSSEIALAGVLILAVAPLALLGAVNPRFNVATFTGVMVLLLPGITYGPIESAFYRVVEVAVGGLTALAVSLFVLPARAHSLAIEAAAQALDLAARSIPELFAGFAKACNSSAIGSIQDSIGQAVTRLQAIGAEARHERISFLEGEPELGPLLRTLLRLRHDLVMIGRAAAEPLPEKIRQRLGPPLARVAETAAAYLRQSGEALVARHARSPLPEAEAALDGCADAFAAIRREGLTVGLPVDTVERIFALGFVLEQLRRNFRDLERCVKEAARTK
ncbi:MAG TPA: FUSC family protein [Xanthobacteraceae bacterium]|nr:FUSC family protein [Xanthobacteraceae bacterium]